MIDSLDLSWQEPLRVGSAGGFFVLYVRGIMMGVSTARLCSTRKGGQLHENQFLTGRSSHQRVRQLDRSHALEDMGRLKAGGQCGLRPWVRFPICVLNANKKPRAPTRGLFVWCSHANQFLVHIMTFPRFGVNRLHCFLIYSAFICSQIHPVPSFPQSLADLTCS